MNAIREVEGLRDAANPVDRRNFEAQLENLYFKKDEIRRGATDGVSGILEPNPPSYDPYVLPPDTDPDRTYGTVIRPLLPVATSGPTGDFAAQFAAAYGVPKHEQYMPRHVGVAQMGYEAKSSTPVYTTYASILPYPSAANYVPLSIAPAPPASTGTIGEPSSSATSVARLMYQKDDTVAPPPVAQRAWVNPAPAPVVQRQDAAPSSQQQPRSSTSEVDTTIRQYSLWGNMGMPQTQDYSSSNVSSRRVEEHVEDEEESSAIRAATTLGLMSSGWNLGSHGKSVAALR